jgi:tetratricopeptide (TPR) repeat protein
METQRSLLGWGWVALSNLLFFGAIGWGLCRWVKRSDDPAGLVVRLVISVVVVVGTFFFALKVGGMGSEDAGLSPGNFGVAFLVAGSAAACGIVLGILWAGSIARSVAGLVTDNMDGTADDAAPPPLYSRAEALRKRGDYAGAEQAIRQQLEQHPGDYQGLIMLAELQAEDLKDLDAARRTLWEIADREDLAPGNRAYALHRIADWDLKYAGDAEAARGALRRLMQLLPETPEEKIAAQRLAHLASQEEMIERREHAPVALARHELPWGLRRESPETARAPEKDPTAVVQDLVGQLERYPQDYEAREKLALTYAEHFGRLDLAVEQLEQLIQASHAPQFQVVRWLNLVADLHLEYRADLESGKAALQRVIELYPNTPAAEVARNRIPYLKLAGRRNTKSQEVALGSFEKDVGLKANVRGVARFASPIQPPTQCP